MELEIFKRKERKRFITETEKNNVPLGTDEIVHIADVLVPNEYRKHKPHDYKIQKALRYFIKYGVIDKPITVIAETNEQGLHNKYILVNEYSRYLALVEWCGLNYIPVRYISIDAYFNTYNNNSIKH